MKKATLPVLLFMFTLSCSCKKDKTTNTPGEDPVEKYPAVETRSPNAGYKPAFEGQTRTFGIRTKTLLDIKVLNRNLQNPWGLAFLHNGHWLISQRGGSMVVLDADGTLLHTINGLPAVNAAGQGGLLDVVTDPDFSINRTVYWAFSENIDGGTLTAVAKGVLDAGETAIGNIQVIYRAYPAYAGNLHYGSRLAFDANGVLYLSTGERSDISTRPQAQDLNSALGKIIRITKNGQPAPGNPFAGQPGALPEIYSYGHRNVQGLAFDPRTNALWQSELGPRGGDEINFIEAGKNYGWPVISYGLEYSGTAIGSGITQQAGMEQPRYYWDPVISPSGLLFYNSDYISEWKGQLLVAALNGQHIARLRLVNGKIAGEERLLAEENQRFRALANDAEGKVYAITDAGLFYQIAKKD